MKIVDSRTFKASEKIAAAEVEVEVGGLRSVVVQLFILAVLLKNAD